MGEDADPAPPDDTSQLARPDRGRQFAARNTCGGGAGHHTLRGFPAVRHTTEIFVIWLPERLRPEAANKLLKVIEEPSRGICFLLVSNNELEVLPTIMSRAQRIEVRPTAVTSDQALDREETAEFRQVFQTLMRDAYQRKIGNIKRLSESTATWGREKLTRFFTYMTAMIRENFIYNLRIPQLNHLDAQDEAFSRNFSPFIHAGNVEEMIAECDRARNEITRNCNAKIVMFDFFSPHRGADKAQTYPIRQ